MMNRFYNAINALIKGFLEDTLFKEDCVSCAVGNILAYVHGFKIKPLEGRKNLEWIDSEGEVHCPLWTDIFCTDRSGNQETNLKLIQDEIYQKEISSSGYPVEVLMKIEHLFETSLKYNKIQLELRLVTQKEYDDHLFEVLCKVIEYLCEVENFTSEEKDSQIKNFQSLCSKKLEVSL